MEGAVENIKETSGQTDGRGWGSILERVVHEGFSTLN